MKSLCAACILCFALLAGCYADRPNTIVVASKNFTEQAILGELLAQHLAARTGLKIERRFYLGGTYICQQALLAGRADVYVEYTGTALTTILKDPITKDSRAVYQRVRQEYAARFDLAVTEPLGFNNTFAIVIRGEDARRLGLRTISDAAPYAPSWRPGFGYEFTERPDGLEGLVQAYGLQFKSRPQIMDLGLLYRALLGGQVDLVAGNSTDGLIAARDLAVLEDDRSYFPPYDAVPVVRAKILENHPEIRAALAELSGKISDQDMRRMNYAVDGERKDPADVVREFLRARGLD